MPSLPFLVWGRKSSSTKKVKLFLCSMSKRLWIGYILISSMAPWCSLLEEWCKESRPVSPQTSRSKIGGGYSVFWTRGYLLYIFMKDPPFHMSSARIYVNATKPVFCTFIWKKQTFERVCTDGVLTLFIFMFLDGIFWQKSSWITFFCLLIQMKHFPIQQQWNYVLLQHCNQNDPNRWNEWQAIK